jgi:hypothetical protein
MSVPYPDAGLSDTPYQAVNLRIEDCGDTP